MPFTPFHCGVGLLAKGTAPRRVSFTGFIASQVVIDLETAYYLVTHDWPVHRSAHTFVAAIPLGALVGLGVWAVARWARSLIPKWFLGSPELALTPAVVGGLLGGATHPLLDGIMHWDPIPFWPFWPGNPLLGLTSLSVLHFGCVAAAFAGIVIWRFREGRWPLPASHARSGQ
jgi:hypothetical protein